MIPTTYQAAPCNHLEYEMVLVDSDSESRDSSREPTNQIYIELDYLFEFIRAHTLT